MCSAKRVYTYDSNGNRQSQSVERTPASGSAVNDITTYVYDVQNRLTQILFQKPAGTLGQPQNVPVTTVIGWPAVRLLIRSCKRGTLPVGAASPFKPSGSKRCLKINAPRCRRTGRSSGASRRKRNAILCGEHWSATSSKHRSRTKKSWRRSRSAWMRTCRGYSPLCETEALSAL